MKRYNEFISESIRDKMTGKTKEEIIKDMSLFGIFSAVADNKLPKDYLPSREEALVKIPLNDLLYWVKNDKIPEYYKPKTEEIKNDEDYKKLDAIDKTYLVSNFDLDESLLPTDKEIDENIEEEFENKHGMSIKDAEKLVDELKKYGVEAKIEIVKDKILEPGNRYFIIEPIRIYYYQIQNGNHVILKIVNKKEAEEIADNIRKYGVGLSEIIINEPDSYFDSTKMSVKQVKELKEKLKSN